jgi:hypothetical protein
MKQATIEQIFNLFAENKIEIENPISEDADIEISGNNPIKVLNTLEIEQIH